MNLAELQAPLARIISDFAGEESRSRQNLYSARVKLRRKAPACGIHELPAELLIEIFALALLPQHEWSMRRLRSLARVCKLWKSIVVSTPSLWAVIDGQASESDNLFAVRKSAGMPLAITYRYGFGSLKLFNPFLDVLQANLSPWWMLDIDAPERIFAMSQSTFQRPNPSLSHIRLRSSKRFDQPGPWMVLKDGCPIRSLDLTFISVNWESPRLTGLVQLRLRHTEPIPENRLATILMESPSLEELVLINVRLAPTQEWTPVGVLRLKSLKLFHLEQTLSTTFDRIVAMLRLSPTTEVTIVNVDVSCLAEGHDPVLFHVVSPIPSNSPYIRAKFKKNRLDISAKLDSQRKIRHYIHGSYAGIRLFKPMTMGCWARFVVKLEMDLPKGYHNVPVDGIARLSNLEVLVMSGEAWVADALSVLSRRTEREPDRSMGEWPCPRLTSLDIAFLGAGGFTGLAFLPTQAQAISKLVQCRWGDRVREEELGGSLSALSSLTIRVPDGLSDAPAIDALATLACRSAKVLGPGVIKFVSME
ncbi:hypothetical protein FRB90_012046 [Tulasnella sp. 427]|nr:hypothetical protein FRB90_012046 [Tulasnella sp. 427]